MARSPRIAALAILLLIAPVAVLHAQTATTGNGDPGRKQAHAVRVPNGSVRVDGRLAEDVWNDIVPVVDFVQKEPREGAPPHPAR